MIWMHTWAKLHASQNVFVGLILLWLKSINMIWKLTKLKAYLMSKNGVQMNTACCHDVELGA